MKKTKIILTIAVFYFYISGVLKIIGLFGTVYFSLKPPDIFFGIFIYIFNNSIAIIFDFLIATFSILVYKNLENILMSIKSIVNINNFNG